MYNYVETEIYACHKLHEYNFFLPDIKQGNSKLIVSKKWF